MLRVLTFVYAKGYSYLSTDPRTCLNCHIMSPQSRPGFKRAVIATPRSAWTATCRPAAWRKWVAKADQGFRHSRLAFTLQNFKEPIEIKSWDRRIVAGATACAATPTSSTR